MDSEDVANRVYKLLYPEHMRENELMASWVPVWACY
jgi:hypothetical protein